MKEILMVGAGGFLGAVARYGAGLLSVHALGAGRFPAATWAINIIGSFLLGLAMGFFARNPIPAIYYFCAVGFCGGFTTFSAFSFEVLQMLRQEQWVAAGIYIILSVVCCVAAAWGGWVLAKGI